MQFLWENHRDVIRDTVGTDMSLRSYSIMAFWFKMIPAFIALFYSIPASGIFDTTLAEAGAKGAAIRLGIAISGIVLGPAIVMILAFYLKLAGHWLGGKARWNPLRIVLAWAQTPHFLALLLGFAIFQGRLNAPTVFMEGVFTALWYLFYAAAAFATFLTVVYYLVGVSEVFGFSLMRSLASILIAHTLLAATYGITVVVLAVFGISWFAKQ